MDFSIGDSLRQSFVSNWNDNAIIEPEKDFRLTYQELAYVIDRYQSIWEQLNIDKGDKIAICSRNCSEWIAIYLAAICGGYVAIVVPNNIAVEEIAAILNHSDSRIVYLESDKFNNRDLCQIKNVDMIFDIFSNRCLTSAHSMTDTSVNEIANSVISSMKNIEINDFVVEDYKRDDGCSVVYSSGSSGASKGILLSYRYLEVNIPKAFDFFPHTPGDFEICINPFFHVFGLVWDSLASLCKGMTLVVLRNVNPAFVCEVMQEYPPRKFYSPPFYLLKMLEYSLGNHYSVVTDSCLDVDREYASILRKRILETFGNRIEKFGIGGAPLESNVASFLLNTISLSILPTYASTEGGLISMSELHSSSIGSSGRVLKPSCCRVISSNGHSISGEIQINEHTFLGYYKNPQSTNAALTEDGWFKTGDFGYIDEEGNLFITGRCKDMLLTSNGENIYPKEIEEAMNASSFVKESILVQRGEKLYAIVVPNREKAETEGLDSVGLNKKIDEVVREASKKLPGFTIISGFELRDEPLERTPKGSLKRYLYSDGIKEN